MQAMLAIAEEAGKAPDPGPGAPTRPAATALFALSQACLHDDCREQLQQLGMPALIERLNGLKDPELSSNCRRIQVRAMQEARSCSGWCMFAQKERVNNWVNMVILHGVLGQTTLFC